MIMMKDKLEKTGHRRLYYRLRATCLLGLHFLSLAGAAAIPVGISYRLAQAKAVEETSQVLEEEGEEGEEENLPLSEGE